MADIFCCLSTGFCLLIIPVPLLPLFFFPSQGIRLHAVVSSVLFLRSWPTQKLCSTLSILGVSVSLWRRRLLLDVAWEWEKQPACSQKTRLRFQILFNLRTIPASAMVMERRYLGRFFLIFVWAGGFALKVHIASKVPRHKNALMHHVAAFKCPFLGLLGWHKKSFMFSGWNEEHFL